MSYPENGSGTPSVNGSGAVHPAFHPSHVTAGACEYGSDELDRISGLRGFECVHIDEYQPSVVECHSPAAHGRQSRPSLSPTASCAGPKSSTIVPGQALSPATPARTTTFEPTAGFGGVFDDPAITRIMPSVERNDRANTDYPHRTNVEIRAKHPFCVVLSCGNDFAHALRRGRRGSRIGETMVGQRSASFSRA